MFDKYYVLDTNILLEDATNIYKLSQDGKNLIILAETVLDEIDTKKSGFDEINFQAREFARILEDSNIISSTKKDL
ncbi:PIN domain-containing protein [Aliarcobacter butzleri]|nr:PIN domain-containing protein [Aliarcobacter butzleri]